MRYFNTNKPHSFFCRIPVVLENRRSSRGGGGAHPLHPPPRSAPDSTLLILLPKSSCLLLQFSQVVLSKIVQLYSRFLVLSTATCSRHYIVTENCTLLGGTYLSEPNKEVLPWLPSLEKVIITASRGIPLGFLAQRGTSL